MEVGNLLRIAICDDDKKDIEYMEEIISESGMDKNEVYFHEYDSGEDLLMHIKELPSCDLLILDMQMGEMDGHETAAAFRKVFPKTILVFWSGVCRPTDESFKATPFRYFFKNYSKEMLIQEMQAVVREVKSKQTVPYIMGSYYYNTVRFEPDDILYIENYRFGSIIHPNQEKVDYDFEKKGDIKTKKKLNELYEELQPFGFEYAHNSYIVNMNYVTKMSSEGDLKLKDDTVLRISRSKQKSFREAFSELMGYKY